MKIVSGKRFCRALEKKGWLRKRITGSHHIYSHPEQLGSVAVVPVHGNADLNPNTQRALMKATGIKDSDL